MLPDFELVRPNSLGEALAALDEDRVALCGGTELLLAMKMGMLLPEALVDLSRLEDLTRIETEGTEFTVGAAVTHRRLAAHPDLRRRLPMLADVEERVGNARVRAQGSVGGNLCFAEPRSDLATALIALDASVVLRGPSGSRQVRVEDFIEGPYTTVREDDELLTEIRIPVANWTRSVYRKFQTMERPTVGVAVMVQEDRTTVVVGAVAAVPVRADFASPAAVDIDEILGEVEPFADLTGSVDYKLHITRTEIGRALEAVQ